MDMEVNGERGVRSGPSGVPLHGRRLFAALLPLLLVGYTPAFGERGPVFTVEARHSAPALHTELDEAVPGEGEVVEGPVDELRLRFTTAVQLPLTSLILRNAEGEPVPTGEPERAPGEGDDLFIVPVDPPLEAGGYTVEWATAGPDGHVIQGSYAFQVAQDPAVPPEEPVEAAEPPAPPPAPPQPVETMEDRLSGPASVAARWAHLLALTLVLGALAFRAFVLPGLRRREGLEGALGEVRGRVRRLGLAAAVLGIAVLPLRLWFQAEASFPVAGVGFGTLGTLLFRTPWGWGWLVAAGGLAVVVTGLVLAAPAREGGGTGAAWGLASLGALALPASVLLSGHAWGVEGALAGPARGAIFLHVLGVGVWFGGLGCLVLAGLPALRAARGDGEVLAPGLSAMVNGFSRVALGAVALLILSGGFLAWTLLGSPEAAFTTQYGRTLLLKIGVALLAFALGFYNWRVVRPSLEREPRIGVIRIPSGLEFIIGAVVLFLTSILVIQPLP